MVDDVFFAFGKWLFGRCYNDGFVVVEDVGVVADDAAVDLKIAAEGFGGGVHFFLAPLAVPFDEGYFVDGGFAEYAYGIGDFKFQIFDGVVDALLALAAAVGLQQTDGHGVVVGNDFGPRENDVLRNASVGVARCYRHAAQPALFERKVVFVAFGVVVGFRRIDERVGDVSVCKDIQFVDEFGGGAVQACEVGIDVAAGVEGDVDVVG